jgi:hypothetical protein
MKRINLLFALLLIANIAFSQETEKEKRANANLSLEGTIGFSVGKNIISLNVGGPTFMLKCNENWKVGIGALPSIVLLNGNLGARLGVSPRIDYKNLMFTAPFFHIDVTNEWIASFGMGYKFHKK